MSWFCKAQPSCVSTTYNAIRECGDMNAKDQEIKDLKRQLKERPPHPDSLMAAEIKYHENMQELGRKAQLAALGEQLKDKSFRLEEITAHRDALVVRLEEKQQELADCRALLEVLRAKK